MMKEREEQRRKQILEEEWARAELAKQPDLSVMRDTDALEAAERQRQEQQNRKSITEAYDLPWSEEHSAGQSG